jgi:hypothetical protein
VSSDEGESRQQKRQPIQHRLLTFGGWIINKTLEKWKLKLRQKLGRKRVPMIEFTNYKQGAHRMRESAANVMNQEVPMPSESRSAKIKTKAEAWKTSSKPITCKT